MKKLFNWLMVLAACVGAFYGIGLIVPRSQTQGSKTTFTVMPDKLFGLVSDVSTWPEWHPDVASAVERPKNKDNVVWRVTEKSGASYDLEVTTSEDPTLWQCTYVIDETRYTLRFEFGGYGQGGRGRIVRTVDTRNTWKRAKSFLWSREETAPIGLLNALSQQLGEPGTAKED